jgi:hypothetical protein
MEEHVEYRIAAATNIIETFRRFGWTPPSELPEYQEKWARFQAESKYINANRSKQND